MRWAFYGVDCEGGGKEHSTFGGSHTTAERIVEAVWNKKAPVYFMYDFISLKGTTGKMSGSRGNVASLRTVNEIYLPYITRFLFTRTKPNKEFAIAFDDEKSDKPCYRGNTAVAVRLDSHSKFLGQKIIPNNIPNIIEDTPFSLQDFFDIIVGWFR